MANVLRFFASDVILLVFVIVSLCGIRDVMKIDKALKIRNSAAFYIKMAVNNLSQTEIIKNFRITDRIKKFNKWYIFYKNPCQYVSFDKKS